MAGKSPKDISPVDMVRSPRKKAPGSHPGLRPGSHQGSNPGSRPSARRLRRSRRWPLWALALVVVIGAGWIVLWYAAASIANRTLAGWVDREAEAGRIYSCDSQTIGGFPFQIKVACDNAGAELKSNQPPYAINALGVTFTAEVWHPTRLVGDIRGPLTVALPGERPLMSASWSRARIAIEGQPPDLERASMAIETPRLELNGEAGAPAQSLFAAKRGELRTGIVAGSARDRPVIDIVLRLDGGAMPTVHPLVAQPTEAEIHILLRGFKDLGPKPWPERFREMQASNGAIEVKALRIVQGNAIVVGAGSLTVNAQGKLDGLIRIAVVGLEEIVPKLQLDRVIGQAVGRIAGSDAPAEGLGALDRLLPGLGGVVRDTANAGVIDNLKKMGQPTEIDKKPATVLPLRFNDGAVYFGMLRIAELPPLF